MNKNEIENSYKVLSAIEREPHHNQRSLAHSLGFSLGKVNFLLKELGKKGFLKLHNFAESDNKSNYLYVLTPIGITEKMRITKAFLQIKELEYNELHKEIQEVKADLQFCR